MPLLFIQSFNLFQIPFRLFLSPTSSDEQVLQIISASYLSWLSPFLHFYCFCLSQAFLILWRIYQNKLLICQIMSCLFCLTLIIHSIGCQSKLFYRTSCHVTFCNLLPVENINKIVLLAFFNDLCLASFTTTGPYHSPYIPFFLRAGLSLVRILLSSPYHFIAYLLGHEILFTLNTYYLTE